MNFLHTKAMHGPQLLQIHLAHKVIYNTLGYWLIFVCTKCFRPNFLCIKFSKCWHTLINATHVHILFNPKSILRPKQIIRYLTSTAMRQKNAFRDINFMIKTTENSVMQTSNTNVLSAFC